MRYISKFIGNSIWAVIDTEAPASVVEDQPHGGHAILFSQNGMQPVEIAAEAMNRQIFKPCKFCELSLQMRLNYCGWCGTHLAVRCPSLNTETKDEPSKPST